MNNPFTSKRFNEIWLKHFYNSKPSKVFEFIKPVEFVKHRKFSCYVNIGINLTKGIYYSINKDAHDYKNKTFLIYDVPAYFEVEDVPVNSRLKVKKVFQYQGFLMNLDDIEDTEAYINSRFSSKNRREFRSNLRRLETCFNITYKFFSEHIEKSEFQILFNQFHDLLTNRFSEKQTDYHHLGDAKWRYYSDLVFEMINSKMASLLVIYKDETPIGITLNYHTKNILFESITVFDPDYYKFSIGKISIIKLLEWCFKNKVNISDFSKGDYEYKHKWSNHIYDFEYHILYDSKSIISVIKANVLELYFKFKLWLRSKNVNALYRRIRFLLSNEGGAKPDKINFKIEKMETFEDDGSYLKIDYASENYRIIRKFVYSFLFANPEEEKNVNVYKHASLNEYILSGTKKSQKIIFT